MKKILIVAGVVMVVAVIILLNLKSGGGGPEVETEPAAYGAITSTVEATGTLEAKAQVDISAQVIGRVKKIYVKEGDLVRKGALLIRLDDEQAGANLTLARARFEQADLLFTRAKSLLDKTLISQEDFETTRTNFEVARAQYVQAQDNWDKTVINAPIAGKVMKLSIEEGETVLLGTMNNAGTVLLTIADMSKLIAIVNVDETDVPNIKPKMLAKVSADALPDTSFNGIVTEVGLMPISNLLSTETAVNFEVKIELSDSSADLRPGMTVNADVVTAEKDSVLRIPVQAVAKRKLKGREASTVLIFDNGKAVLREIETGAASDTDIEIKSGVKAGDQIITGPYRIVSKLKDGARVKVAKRDEPPAKGAGPRASMRTLRRSTR
jgi:HlyD family secretion protein